MTELNCLFPLSDQPIALPLSYWCMAVRLGFEPRSQESKSCVLPITLTDYESAPQRHTGTGLLFSSRVLRVLLKRNTSRSYSFGLTLGNYKRNDPFTSLSLVYRFSLFLATYQAAPRPWAAPHLPVVV